MIGSLNTLIGTIEAWLAAEGTARPASLGPDFSIQLLPLG